MEMICSPASSQERINALLDAYCDAPVGAIISLIAGIGENGEPAIGVTIGDSIFPFFVKEAQTLAQSIEDVIGRTSTDSPGLRALAHGLRAAADIQGKLLS